ncbi:MAG: leucine-rich repeat domain-containing protein [Bacteroidales bacterium]|nr:leucine-rich repeat domain-containing protein [Bacteroidales bacterium]
MGEGVDWENNVSYECVFGGCQNLETLNIGENVQTISPHAFCVDGFTGDLVIPNSVTTIGNYAFAETGFNGTMTMSNAVTSIGAYAFDNTQFSGTLTIPSSVTHIGSGAFYGTGFTTLNYNIPNYDEEITSSYDGPFSGMNSLTTLNIGNNVEVIPNYMFNITSLTGDLDIPNSVTIIGNYAFAETGFNGSLIIPNSVTYIGSNAFDATDFDGTLTIGNSVTSIGEHAFGGVGFTGNLVIPNSVQTIANGAFAGCGFDGTLTLGNSVTSIGDYAFGGVSFTGDLVIPNSVLTIGEEAFVGCEGFTGNLTIGNAVTSIGNSAFSNCYGFSGSLILGNSVETIGNRAFYGCGGFHGELTLPETVTYIGDGSFRSCDELTKVNYNATNCTYMGNSNSPVFYDCVSINQINIGANVENIPNYAFKRCSNVTAMNVAAGVPPTIGSSTFGTVSRSIPVSVPYGTREAYRTAPYWSEFLNIHDDYTPTQYDYYWTADVNQFSSDMTIIGVIQINGVEQENPALEIGAFCGTECRGRQMLTYYSQIDRYQVLLMLYGEDGDVFSFRLYNHENEEELLLGSENEVTFVTNATLGLPLDPYVFNFVSKQTTTLNSGWSWYSTYIEQGGIDGLEMIENSLGEAGLMIQSRNNGYVEAFDYNNSVVWYGTLNAIENEQMYKVHTNASCNVVMTGVSATMSNHPITINSGWNWIGFPSGRNLNLNTALSGMTPEINDIIKGRNGYATYVSYNENNTWYGTLNVLESGQGYMYLSNSETPKTLVYQTGRDAELFNNITADGNIYKPVSERFADNMTITAIVDMDDVELKSESYEIAAFVGDECRGSVKLMYVEPFDRYVAFLTVFGEQSEEMRFVLTNNNDVFSSTEHISFINDGVVGTLTEPAIIHFGTMNLVDENNQTVSVYPNPTNGVFNVYCNGIKRIEVINTVGQLVKDMNVSDDSVAIDLSNEKAGVYMLRVITDNEIIVKRVIKE